MFIFVANRTSSQITAPSIYICTHISLCCKSNFFTDNGAKFLYIYVSLCCKSNLCRCRCRALVSLYSSSLLQVEKSWRYRRRELICLSSSLLQIEPLQISSPSSIILYNVDRQMSIIMPRSCDLQQRQLYNSSTKGLPICYDLQQGKVLKLYTNTKSLPRYYDLQQRQAYIYEY